MVRFVKSILRKNAVPNWLIASTVLGTLFLIMSHCTHQHSAKVDFSTQVKPILNKHCIHCHGGVKESGGFSMMTREKILATADSGKPVIIPGNPSNSELIKRIEHTDEELRMPLEGTPLNQAEIDILKQWIKEGAEWGLHWAYNPVAEVTVPQINSIAKGSVGGTQPSKWALNDIDHFVLKRLAENNLKPNRMADKQAILRRVSLDLIGLPAPKKLAHQFLRTEQPIAYEALVDSLLASPHFGEKWASMWLDLARYADSKGFERDYNRTMYPYRDYIIQAFNDDLPYDQFITEQLAGDLLPEPTDLQLIATGFHRNTPTNDEGGTDNEEYRVAAVIDRVNTTGEAILGSTFSCIQCHGHPYDPFEQKEYYQMMAFFNNTRDMDTHKDYPLLRMYEEAEQEKLADLIAWVEKVDTKERAKKMEYFLKTWQPVIYSIETDSLVNAAHYDTKYLGFRKDGAARIQAVPLTGKSKLILRGYTTVKGGRFSIRLNHPTGEEIAVFNLPFTKPWQYQFIEIPITPTEGKHNLFLQYENPSLDNAELNAFQIDWFYFTEDFPGQSDPAYAQYEQYFWDLMGQSPKTTLITLDNPAERPRKTYVFDRGNWQIHQQEVQPAVPEVLNEFPKETPKNRLGLAQWMVDEKNPLTARTMVNRLWEQLFGQGLVETIEDLGTQSNPPTHPQLLDWLAYQYMYEFEWSTKKLLKTMVQSATYRQSSKGNMESLAKDPYNRFFTRGPRVRLSAEQIRDYTLAVSGLLNPKMFGRPVMPYQPDGIWNTPYNNQAWTLSEADEQYRRAVYTFVKRSSPYPSFETFDVAPRQVCTARRIRTNTPLQALVTLNDPVYVEAAKYFALRLQKEGGQSHKEQIQYGYLLAMGKSIESNKLAVLEKLYSEALQDFREDNTATKDLIAELNLKENSEETAAMTVVANAILNLDEYVMK